MKKNKLFLKLPILLSLLFLVGYFLYQQNLENPVDSNDQKLINFEIQKGETAKNIGKKLEEKGLINSSLTFYLHTRLNNLGEKILAGTFSLGKSMTISEILAKISDPKATKSIITIQEGLMTKDIDEKLVAMNLIKSGEFINALENFSSWSTYSFLDSQKLQNLKIPLEGYLYPDTYFLDETNFNPLDLIIKTLDNFQIKTAELLPKIKNHSIHEIITMASIIENEVFGLEDRKIVSGILWKRLENNWPIGADVTLLYITDDRKITGEDLQINSPYNTRKFTGLPPGPISNPSTESIEAAMYPTESEYWFYLTTKDGEVIYSTTNEQHNQNKAKYLH